MRKFMTALWWVGCTVVAQAAMAGEAPVAPASPPAPMDMQPFGPVRVPPGCEPAMRVARAGAKSPADLSGALPVADYLDALYDCIDPRGVGLADLYKPRNDWLEKDAKRYTEVLARGKFSWLVVPVQTQYFGFDRIERALLSAEIADAFAAQGDAPSPFLAARALGEIRRRYEPGAPEALAATLGASRMLLAFAGHDGKHQMTLTLQLLECKGGACWILKRHDWRNLAFSDERPPFLAIRAIRGALVSDLLGTSAAASRPIETQPNRSTAVDLSALGKAPSAAEPAAVAAVIAALAPHPDELGRDRLEALALREALNGAPTAANRVRAAYAAFRLKRRPYALALLEGRRDPAATTLRELLNGNLIEAQAELPRVAAADLKMILAFAVQDLRLIYDRRAEFDYSAARRVFGESAGAWPSLVERRVSDLDTWGSRDASTPKLLLDDVFPVAGQDLKSVVKGLRVVGRDADPDASLVTASLHHLALAQGKLPPGSCCSATRENSSWSIYWLAESLIESNVFKSVTFRLVAQGTPDAAAKLLEVHQEYFAGHPDFEVLRFRTAAALAELAPNEMAGQITRQAETAEASAAYWSQGQNEAAMSSVLRSSETMFLREAYTKDFPRRGWWPPSVVEGGSHTDWACEAFSYSQVDPSPATFCLGDSPPQRRASVLAEFAARFHGDSQAAALLKQVMPRNPSADPVAELRAAIAKEPENWSNYRDLGLLLLRRDANYREAQKVYLSYPGFKRRDPEEPVRIANDAYEVGTQLFWRGQAELARPLYELSAGLQTGSAGSMTSEIRLALIDGDYESAAQGSIERALRYPNAYGYRDYLSLLHVLGHGDDARAGFTQIAKNFDNPSAWLSMVVGQRMNSTTADQFRRWVLSEDIRAARYRGRHFAPIYALWWMTTDRTPGADFVQTMQRIEADETRRISPDGFALERSHPTMDDVEVVPPSSLWGSAAPRLQPGSSVSSEYVLLADALSAYHAGNYEAAVTKFIALSDHYPIESGDTAVALGYFAYASAKTGDKLHLEAFLPSIPDFEQSFDYWLAKAYFAAAKHDAESARRALVRAFNTRPYTDSRPIMTEYQYVEACETVLKETGDPRVLTMIVDWAKAWQRIQPMAAWAYAVEADHSTVATDVTRAIAITLYLDPLSPRLAKFDAARMAAARAWLKSSNPFLKPKQRPEPRPGV
jgi:hypothetical protein